MPVFAGVGGEAHSTAITLVTDAYVVRGKILTRHRRITDMLNSADEDFLVIKIEDADHNHNRILYTKHYHDGRDLQLEYAERTLAYLQRLWGHEVILETVVNGKKVLLSYNDKGFSTKPLK